MHYLLSCLIWLSPNSVFAPVSVIHVWAGERLPAPLDNVFLGSEMEFVPIPVCSRVEDRSRAFLFTMEFETVNKWYTTLNTPRSPENTNQLDTLFRPLDHPEIPHPRCRIVQVPAPIRVVPRKSYSFQRSCRTCLYSLPSCLHR